MKKLIVLGTGNALVTRCYNTCFAIHNGSEYFLVDAGGGNQILSILENKNIKINDIKNIFVTHAHTDHVLGIIWILRVIGQNILKEKYEGNLNVYAHGELIQKIKTICELTLPQKAIKLFDNRIKFIEVNDGNQKQIMNMNFTFFDIYSTKEKQFGFVLEAEEQKITFLGDEPLNKEKCEKYLENADWLLSEAFCRYDDREIYKPYEKHHSTVKDAAEIAQKFGVKNLILWHTEDDNIKTRKEIYTEEAKQYFDGEIYVPDDLEEINLC